MKRIPLTLVFTGCLLLVLGIISLPFSRDAEELYKDKQSIGLLAYLYEGDHLNIQSREGWIYWLAGEYLEVFNQWGAANPEKLELLFLYYDLGEEEGKAKRESTDMTVVEKGPMTLLYVPPPAPGSRFLLDFDPADAASGLIPFRIALRKIALSDYNHALAFGRSHGFNPIFLFFLIRGGMLAASRYLTLESFFAGGGRVCFTAFSRFYAVMGIIFLVIGLWVTRVSLPAKRA